MYTVSCEGAVPMTLLSDTVDRRQPIYDKKSFLGALVVQFKFKLFVHILQFSLPLFRNIA